MRGEEIIGHISFAISHLSFRKPAADYLQIKPEGKTFITLQLDQCLSVKSAAGS
jgi:hypothetical protein